MQHRVPSVAPVEDEGFRFDAARVVVPVREGSVTWRMSPRLPLVWRSREEVAKARPAFSQGAPVEDDRLV